MEHWDVVNEPMVVDALKCTEAAFGPPEILINAVGGNFDSRSFIETDMEAFEQVLKLNKHLANIMSVTAFLIDPDEPRLLYAGTAYNGVYQSVDGGKMWQPIGPTEMSEDVIESMAWGPNGEIFFVTTNGVWLGEKEEDQ